MTTAATTYRCELCGRPIARNSKSTVAPTATHGPRHQTCEDRLVK